MSEFVLSFGFPIGGEAGLMKCIGKEYRAIQNPYFTQQAFLVFIFRLLVTLLSPFLKLLTSPFHSCFFFSYIDV